MTYLRPLIGGLLFGATLTLLAVAPPPLSRVRFAWLTPPTRTNGLPLAVTEIDHYTVLWSCDTGQAGAADIRPATLTSIVLERDWLGNCELAMTATDTAEHTSPPSAPVHLLIKLPKPATGGVE